jgi:integrase
MPRPATGQVVERDGKQGTTYALRFRAYGKRRYVTTPATSRAEAAVELENVLADVRRGIWREPAPPPVVEEPQEEPTFWEFAREWMETRGAEGLAAKTIADLEWSLNKHLIHFGHHRLSEITPQEVDRFKIAKARERQELEAARGRGEKVRERGLSNNSINHVLSDLAQVLETAVEYGLIAQNPASGKRRRLKSTRPARPWVEPEQLPALLDAAKIDGARVGRVLLAVLTGAGLRIGEALALRWQQVDLPTGTLHVVDAKTAAGIRSVDLTPALREELTVWRANSRHIAAMDYVLPTSTGKKHNPSNLRRDVLAPAVKAANVKLAETGIAELGTITFHSLRRTYASLRCACGDDVAYTSAQIGHEDARFTLRVYTGATKRRERLSGPHLKAYDTAIEWARMGTNADVAPTAMPTKATKNPA